MDDRVPQELLAVAAEVLPGQDMTGAMFAQGGSHDVVLLPGTAAVRIARNPGAVAALPRRTELLRRLAAMDLPFATPIPLSGVVRVEGRTAVALSWLSGRPRPKGQGGEPRELTALLRTLREIDRSPLAELLGEPREYAGGARWAEVMWEEVVPRLPHEWRTEAGRRVRAALDLPSVPPSLVHGDLAGTNMHWHDDGRLAGVLDWDLAQPFDPAIDAACLSWYGWETVRAAVDQDTLHRAGTWYLVFGLEQIAFAVLNDRPESAISDQVGRITAWLERTAGWQPPHE